MHVDEEKEDKKVKEVQQEWRVLSGPKGSAQTPTKVKPWFGRLRSPSASPNASVGSTGKHVNSKKGKNKVDHPMAVFDVSTGHSMVDRDSSGDESLMKSLAFQKCKLLEYAGPHVLSIQWKGCDSFVACHFMYMENVMQDVEPTCFSEAVGVKEWDAPMDDEIYALGDSVHGT